MYMSAIQCPKPMKTVNIHVLVFHHNIQFLHVKLLINVLQKQYCFQMNYCVLYLFLLSTV
jgi:hypothetical protein